MRRGAERIVVADPVAEHFAGPDEETKVPCPVCRRTLIPASLAAAVNRVLRLLNRMIERPPAGTEAPARSDDEPKG